MLNKNFALGLFLGREGVSGLILDVDDNVVCRQKLPVEAKKGAGVLVQLQKLSESLIKEAGTSADEILGVGVAAGGLVDIKQGRVVLASAYAQAGSEAWLDVRGYLEEALAMPVFVDNDTNSFLRAEQLLGAAKGYYNIAGIKIGKGVGGALMVDGRVFHGASSVAGEIGHTLLHPEGRRCACGEKGCVEAYLGEEGMLERARDAVKKHSSSKLVKEAGKDLKGLSAEILVKAAKARDALAVALLDEMAQDLGRVLRNLINLLNPELIVVGGRTIEEAPGLLAAAVKQARGSAFARAEKAARIEVSKLGEQAPEIGAALLVSRRLMH